MAIGMRFMMVNQTCLECRPFIVPPQFTDPIQINKSHHSVRLRPIFDFTLSVAMAYWRNAQWRMKIIGTKRIKIG